MFCLLGNVTSLIDISGAVNRIEAGWIQIMQKFCLCNRLKVARAEKSLSQGQLGLLAGVTRQTIGSIETGQYNPSTLLALLLAQCLNKRVEELFFLEEEER